MSVLEKKMLRQLFARGIVTKKAFKEWGLATDSCCPFCGREDTVRHRIFDEECGDEELKQLRRELAVRERYRRAGGSD